MGEKTEKATPKKLRDARKKGQVAKSQDLPSAFTFIVSVWATLAMSHFLYQKLGSFLMDTFKGINQPNLDGVVSNFFTYAIEVIFAASLPVMLIVTAIGVLVTFLTVGPCFSTEVFKLDPKKFDPIQNLKSKFKLRTLVELLKSLLKITVASYIIYDVVYNSLPVLVKAVSMPMYPTLMIFYTFLMEVVMKVGLFFIVVAVADFIYQRRDFAKEMKMEKFEVKQEYKNSEGDPHIKSKRRQIAQEIAYQEGPAGGVRRANAVVTNPTHLAIAIGYERELDAAPYIIAMGEGGLAERMVAIAKQYDIPIVRNIPLAHKLWENGDVHEFVPEDSYEAVAEILRWVAALNTENAYEYEERIHH